MIYGYIYKITIENPESVFDGCYYIGQRKCNHNIEEDKYYGSGKYIKHYQNKYGTKGLNKEILELCESKKEIDEKEKFYINHMNENDCFSNGGKCLNISEGGEKGWSAESHLKGVQTRKNNGSYKLSKEVLEVISIKNRGKRRTPEMIEKYRLSKLGNKNPMYGKKQSEKQKKELKKYWEKGVHNKGKTLEETYGKEKGELIRQKFRDLNKGKKYWNNGKQNKFQKECPGEGWVRGRLPYKKRTYNDIT